MSVALLTAWQVRQRACLIAAVAALGGCATSTDPETAVVVGVAARTAVRDTLGFAEIDFVVMNAGDRAVYVERCGAKVSADVDQRTDTSAWRVAAEASAGCYSSLWLGPLRLEPGRSVRSTQAARVAAGDVRLRVKVSTDFEQAVARFVASDVISVR